MRTEPSWSALLTPRLILPLAVLLGGNLLHSMNLLITDHGHAFAEHRCRHRRRPSDELAAAAFVAPSIIAATGTPVVSKATGNRRAFCVGAVIYATGSLLCGLAPSIALIIGGRFIQGLGGGSCLLWLMSLSAPSSLSRYGRASSALLAGVWSVMVLVGPLVGGVFAGYGYWRGAFFAVSAAGGLLAIGAFLIFPATPAAERPNRTALSVPPCDPDLRLHRLFVISERRRRLGGQGALIGCRRSLRPDDADRSRGPPHPCSPATPSHCNPRPAQPCGWSCCWPSPTARLRSTFRYSCNDYMGSTRSSRDIWWPLHRWPGQALRLRSPLSRKNGQGG